MWGIAVLGLLLLADFILIKIAEHRTQFLIFSSSNVPKIGIISSIHGNEPAPYHAIMEMLPEFEKIKAGEIRVIPNANEYGLALNMRRNGILLGRDLNRGFAEPKGFNKKITDFLEPCSCIIDLHEGFDWANINPASVGSTIMTSGFDAAREQFLLDKLNALPETKAAVAADPRKVFTFSRKKAGDIPGSLSSWAAANRKTYVLLETSGQNDIQPLETRKKQVKELIRAILFSYSI